MSSPSPIDSKTNEDEQKTTEVHPIICPRCKSPYWNKPRRMEGKKQEVVIKEKRKTLK